LKIAIVHEWLDTYAGSERVIEQLIDCFPTADLFAIVDFLPEQSRGFLRGRVVRTSFIQHLPFSRRMFRHYLPLMPFAVEQLDMTGYDVIISSNHAVAKGVLTGPDQLHISYIHTPMRYAWDLQNQYLRQIGLEHGIKSILIRWILHRMRQWDARSANGVDVFVANSAYIARRIQKAYRRDSIVIPPPVAVEDFTLETNKDDFYLVVSRFVPYKRVDLIVSAFAEMPEHRLLVVGEGPERSRIHAAARGAANIEIKSPVSKTELIKLLQRSCAFICAAEEDFGISMVEAQACGTAVIAYRRGGANEIVCDIDAASPTGILFESQTSEAITHAVRRFETMRERITSKACRENSLRFSVEHFREKIITLVERLTNSATKVHPQSTQSRQHG
jgi:glycosyltransferase involved in cell wall biosynthesis